MGNVSTLSFCGTHLAQHILAISMNVSVNGELASGDGNPQDSTSRMRSTIRDFRSCRYHWEKSAEFSTTSAGGQVLIIGSWALESLALTGLVLLVEDAIERIGSQMVNILPGK
jgi:hypothetical protein